MIKEEEGEEDPTSCDFCDAEDVALHKVNHGYGVEAQIAFLCDFCYGSLAGNAHFSPRVYPKSQMFKVMAQMFNILLAKLSDKS